MGSDVVNAVKGIKGFVSLDPIGRFWRYVRKTEYCWIWTGSKNSSGPYGYGELYVRGKKVKAHRFSWEIHNGPIPSGLYACHHCDNPPCVRPDHLFIGTQRDNALDCERKNRFPHTRLTYCKRGHEFSLENTHLHGVIRCCRTCHMERDRAYIRKKAMS